MGFALCFRCAIPRPTYVVGGTVCIFRDMRLAASVEIPLFSSAIFDVCKAGQLNPRPQHPQTAQFVEIVRRQFSAECIVGVRREQGFAIFKTHDDGGVVKVPRRSAKLYEVPYL